jgi:hypothetical protein
VVLLLARDIGPVGSILRHADADEQLERTYPTVQAAVEAAEHDFTWAGAGPS